MFEHVIKWTPQSWECKKWLKRCHSFDEKKQNYHVYQAFRPNLGKSSDIISFGSLLTTSNARNIVWGCLVITWIWLKPKQEILSQKSIISYFIHWQYITSFNILCMSQGIPGIKHFRKCLGNSRNAWYSCNCLGNSGNLIYLNKFPILGKSTTPIKSTI